MANEIVIPSTHRDPDGKPIKSAPFIVDAKTDPVTPMVSPDAKPAGIFGRASEAGKGGD